MGGVLVLYVPLFLFPLTSCATPNGPAHMYLMVHKSPVLSTSYLSAGGRQARKDTMKFVVCLSVLVGVLSLGQAYPAKASPSSSASLDRKKAELRALEQELKGLMQRAGLCGLLWQRSRHEGEGMGALLSRSV